MSLPCALLGRFATACSRTPCLDSPREHAEGEPRRDARCAGAGLRHCDGTDVATRETVTVAGSRDAALVGEKRDRGRAGQAVVVDRAAGGFPLSVLFAIVTAAYVEIAPPSEVVPLALNVVSRITLGLPPSMRSAPPRFVACLSWILARTTCRLVPRWWMPPSLPELRRIVVSVTVSAPRRVGMPPPLSSTTQSQPRGAHSKATAIIDPTLAAVARSAYRGAAAIAFTPLPIFTGRSR